MFFPSLLASAIILRKGTAPTHTRGMRALIDNPAVERAPGAKFLCGARLHLPTTATMEWLPNRRQGHQDADAAGRRHPYHVDYQNNLLCHLPKPKSAKSA